MTKASTLLKLIEGDESQWLIIANDGSKHGYDKSDFPNKEAAKKRFLQKNPDMKILDIKSIDITPGGRLEYN